MAALKGDERIAALRAAGLALGAFHRKYRKVEDPATGGFGFLMYTHGDFHGGNVFYEACTRRVTFIDIPGMARSVAVNGCNMIMDVKRMLNMTFDDPAKNAFVDGYALNFTDPEFMGKYTRVAITAFVATKLGQDLNPAFV